MTFGLRNAAQTFQRFMNHTVLQGLDYLACYIDDVIVASNDMKEHREHLKELFERFDEFGITINVAKYSFGQTKIKFLGYEVSTEGLKPLPEKVQAIINYKNQKM
ncbi:hypothetical protein O0L34_g19490 [Tuta absoluta]|nr:hypothetical protein O0L34_g19490 [Tuta absoluta]